MASCPRCGDPMKDGDHMSMCQASIAVMTWNKSVNKVNVWLDENYSCPDLAKLILTVLRGFKDREEVVVHEGVIFD